MKRSIDFLRQLILGMNVGIAADGTPVEFA